MTRIALIALLLTLPRLAAATECHSEAKSCADGLIWSEETSSCIQPSS